MNVRISVTTGELFDRMTILEQKIAHSGNPAKLAALKKQLSVLRGTSKKVPRHKKLKGLIAVLRTVNKRLWNAEDAIRDAEQKRDTKKFVQAASAIIRLNDRRSRIKQSINALFAPDVPEEKIYARVRNS